MSDLGMALIVVCSLLLYSLIGIVIATIFTKNINSAYDIFGKETDEGVEWMAKMMFWPIYLVGKIITFTCATMLNLGADIRNSIENDKKET